MFSRIANFIDVKALIVCSKQISQCTDMLRCAEKPMNNKYLKLLSKAETFPFLTNLDLSMVTDINLSLSLMNKLDYIKSLNIMGILPLEKSTANLEYYDALYQTIKKQERIIEVLEIDLTVFYYLNICDLNLTNCHFLRINIEIGDEAMSENRKLKYYSKFLPRDEIELVDYIRGPKLMIPLKNLETFHVELRHIRNDHTLNLITIEQPMNKLKTVKTSSEGKYKQILAGVGINFCDDMQVLPSLINSIDGISDFSNNYYPSLRKIVYDNYHARKSNKKEIVISPEMIPNIQEIELTYPTKNTFLFTNNSSFKHLKKFTTGYAYAPGNDQLSIFEFLFIVSKYMKSLEILTIDSCIKVDNDYDLSKLEINNSLKYIVSGDIATDMLKKLAENKELLRLKFPRLKKIKTNNYPDPVTYINGLLFQKPTNISPIAEIKNGSSIFADNPNFDIFHTVHFTNDYRYKVFFKSLNKPKTYTDKTIIIGDSYRCNINFEENFPDFKEIIVKDEGMGRDPSIIDIQYDTLERLILFLGLIKTEMRICLREERRGATLIFSKIQSNPYTIEDLIEYFKEKSKKH